MFIDGLLIPKFMKGDTCIKIVFKILNSKITKSSLFVCGFCCIFTPACQKFFVFTCGSKSINTAVYHSVRHSFIHKLVRAALCKRFRRKRRRPLFLVFWSERRCADGFVESAVGHYFWYFSTCCCCLSCYHRC